MLDPPADVPSIRMRIVDRRLEERDNRLLALAHGEVVLGVDGVVRAARIVADGKSAESGYKSFATVAAVRSPNCRAGAELVRP